MPTFIKELDFINGNKYKALAALICSFFLCLANPTANVYSVSGAVLPFVAMIMKGVDLTVAHSLFLSGLLIIYIFCLMWPFYFVLGQYCSLLVYLPIGVVFYKEPHEPASLFFRIYEYIFWDVPLLLWIHILSWMGLRGLKVSPMMPQSISYCNYAYVEYTMLAFYVCFSLPCHVTNYNNKMLCIVCFCSHFTHQSLTQ